MGWEQQIRLIEQRKEQAAKNLQKKIMLVLKVMGYDVISQPEAEEEMTIGELTEDAYWLDDDEKNEYPIFTGDTTCIGRHFDALTSGINLQMYANTEDKTVSQIWVNYNGHRVYEETSGTLEAYVPDEKWENALDLLFQRARQFDKLKSSQPEDDNITKAKQSQLNRIMESFRKKWGI